MSNYIQQKSTACNYLSMTWSPIKCPYKKRQGSQVQNRRDDNKMLGYDSNIVLVEFYLLEHLFI